MKSLEEHNREASERQDATFYSMNRPRLNGIACPKCGAELYDSTPMVTLCSVPAQKNIHCATDGCGFVGYRVA